MASQKRHSKVTWKTALGASTKPKRLKLVEDKDGFFNCPVVDCENASFKSKRGCRKHVCLHHGWYFFFDEKPDAKAVLPSEQVKTFVKPIKDRSDTTKMPTFDESCSLRKTFKYWLSSPVGGSKGISQAEQIVSRVMKFLMFCCEDHEPTWNIPNSVTDYCIGSVTLISDFVDYLINIWGVGNPGVIGYLNSISHLMDHRKIVGLVNEKPQTLIASEVFLHRMKKSLNRKMRASWMTLLSVDHFKEHGCWATLEEMQQVIPFHGERFAQLVLMASNKDSVVPSHELSFATSFIVAVLFLMVKAARPMSYQFLTVKMISTIKNDGIIDQCTFKTQEKYGFDSLIFDKPVINIVNGYIECIRPRLNPACDFLLVTRTGKQLTRICDVFGRLVFQAIGKYINPTRYRQIVETTSAERLNTDEQATVSLDQKHTSNVAKIHYQKLESQKIAKNAKELIAKLSDNSKALQTLQNIPKVPCVTSCSENSVIDFESSESFQETGNSLTTTNLSIDQNTEVTGPQRPKRAPKVPFSAMEDNFLKNGIEKYGPKWTMILNDSAFLFHSTRKTATLLTRAKTCKFI